MSDNRLLLVEKLPAALPGDKLYEIFGIYGAIRQIRIGDDAMSKGTAIVVFRHSEDAERARAALHGQQMGSRTLGVSVYDKAALQRSIDKRRKKRDREGEYRAHMKGESGVTSST